MDILRWIFNDLIPTALLIVTGVGLLDVVFRSERQFGLARQTKNFWLTYFGIGLVFLAVFRFGPLWVPFEGLLFLAFLVGLMYYFGPERSRMGPRWRGGRGDDWRSGRTRGGW